MASVTPCAKDVQLDPIPHQLDLRSPAGGVLPQGARIVLNLIAGTDNRLRRMGGWRRRGWRLIADDAFKNQDLHDQLLGIYLEEPVAPCQAPAVVTLSGPSVVVAGDNYTFTATADSPSVTNYVWVVNGVEVQNGPSNTMTQVGGPVGNYWAVKVTAESPCGSASSPNSYVAFVSDEPPIESLVIAPEFQQVEVGQPFSITSAISPAGTYTYQWQRLFGGSWLNIPGATTDTYTVASATNGDENQYRLIAYNTAGSMASNTATVDVTCALPDITLSAPSSADDATPFDIEANFEPATVDDWISISYSGVLLAEDNSNSVLWNGTLEAGTWQIEVAAYNYCGFATYSQDIIVTSGGVPAFGDTLYNLCYSTPWQYRNISFVNPLPGDLDLEWDAGTAPDWNTFSSTTYSLDGGAWTPWDGSAVTVPGGSTLTIRFQATFATNLLINGNEPFTTQLIINILQTAVNVGTVTVNLDNCNVD